MAVRPSSSPMGSLLSGSGLIVALCFGAWWTAMAVMAGDVGGTLARFAISVAAAMYYLILIRAARSIH
ncbi:MAG: hypothetical protein OER95_17655 [Acidimicrobiia bacterium]|nr:hypothetical protein [Acidimicrobiia bacterium]